jgi:Tol biopolymer transport system component
MRHNSLLTPVVLATGVLLGAACGSGDQDPDASRQTAEHATAPENASTLSGELGRIAFVSDANGVNQIEILDVATGEVTDLTDTSSNAWNPQLSPDGKEIVYASDAEDNVDVYKLWLDNPGEPIRLTFDSGRDDDPTWSPDGMHIIFKSDRQDPDKGDVWMMEPDGANQQNLTPWPGTEEWKPDSISDTEIVLTSRKFPLDSSTGSEVQIEDRKLRANYDEVLILDTTTGEARPVTINTTPDWYTEAHENQIAYTSDEPHAATVSDGYPDGVYVMDQSGDDSDRRRLILDRGWEAAAI